MMISIAIKNWKEECDDYNPDLSNNGGSYFQPFITIETQSGIKILIDDLSCGEFGSRVWITVRMGDHVLAQCKYGAMVDDEWSTFDRSNPLHRAIDEILISEGYSILWADELFY